MTKRATDLIGKPVLSASTGERLGTVADLLLDDAGVALVGIVLHQGWMKHELVLPISSLQTVGPDAVVSRSTGAMSAREWRQHHAAGASAGGASEPGPS